jgi:hypothetical protein
LRLELALGFIHEFARQQGDGIRLFATGAAHHPGAEPIAIRLVGQQSRQNLLLENGKGFGVAEDIGDVDQQLPEQELQLRRIFLEIADIGVLFEIYSYKT